VGRQSGFTTNFCLFNCKTIKHKVTDIELIELFVQAGERWQALHELLLLTINYFVVAHSATVTVCATSADCHLIVTLEILAMCPFIFGPATHLLIACADSRFARFAIFYFHAIFLFESASCLHLTCARPLDAMSITR
jgi:hypothetical protein